MPLEPIGGTPQIFPAQGAIPPVDAWLTTPSVGTAQLTSVTPDYFRAIGTPLLEGRAFNQADDPDAPKMAIVNRAFAKRFLDGSAIGKAFRTNLWRGRFTTHWSRSLGWFRMSARGAWKTGRSQRSFCRRHRVPTTAPPSIWCSERSFDTRSPQYSRGNLCYPALVFSADYRIRDLLHGRDCRKSGLGGKVRRLKYW